MNRLSRLRFAAILLTAGLALTVPFDCRAQGCSSGKTVWSDEFDGTGLPDSSRWSYEKGYIRNNEMQYYTVGRTENVRRENGCLVISALNDSAMIDGKLRPVTSASIHTRGKAEWKYGRIEVRAKLPSCLGSWPAIWMMPARATYGGWPKSGEIDIMEHVGYDRDRLYVNAHTEKYNHTKNTGRGTGVDLPNPDKEFNVYAIDWRRDVIEWFVNGRKIFSIENTENTWEAWPFNDHPFYLILNFAFGGDWGAARGTDVSALPQNFYVDYVRVYE
jgi:beta-glucanase (GH16 family)